MNLKQHIWPTLWLPILCLGIMWSMELVESVLHLSFASLGIRPREVINLRGVLFSPFLHSDWGHLISNSLPFFVLSAILFIAYRKVAYQVFTMIFLLTGLLVWLLARGNTFHIGASGLVYGLFGFIFASGIFRADIKSIAITLIVAFFYGGMVYGVLPGQPGISWESHLLGAIAGAGLAFHYRNVNKVQPPEFMNEPSQRRSFSDFIDKLEQ